MNRARFFSIVCVGLAILLSAKATAATVVFNDSILEQHVRDLIGKPSSPILDTDVNTINFLVLDGLGISDITGLEFFVQMFALFLNDNNVSVLSPISTLPGLLQVHIKNNPVTDLSPLITAPNLLDLRMGTTGITPDFASINSMSLFLLEIVGTNLTDINALSPSTSLDTLILNDTGISNISAVAGFTNLRSLSIERDSVSDLGPLSSLNGLEQLFASDNNISTLTPLTGLPALNLVRLERNPLGVLTALSTLPVLDFLELSETGISDLSGLTGASTTLTFLALFSNNITDLSPLAGLTGLQTLSAGVNSITSANGLAGLTNLQTLNLNVNSITDITALGLNLGLGAGDTISLNSNPLSQVALCSVVPALRTRGATVLVTTECAGQIFPCPLWPVLDLMGGSTFPALSLDWGMDDANADGIPDRWQARLVGLVACQSNRPFHQETVDALTLNMNLILTEPSPSPFNISQLSAVRELVAALILVSDAGRTQMTTSLGLIRNYAVVDLTTKSVTEPFSGLGDLDNDGTSNLQEYLNVIGIGGDIDFFALAAVSPSLDGSVPLPATGRTWQWALILILAALGMICGRALRNSR